MKFPGLIARIEEKRNEQRVSMGNLMERSHFEDVKLVRMIILKCIEV
jgi:hypothetical protein